MSNNLLLQEYIVRMEDDQLNQESIDSVYNEFCQAINNEMDVKMQQKMCYIDPIIVQVVLRFKIMFLLTFNSRLEILQGLKHYWNQGESYWNRPNTSHVEVL